MARHPADVMARLTVVVPRGHQGFWEIIRALHRKGTHWTIADVRGLTHTTVKLQTVRDYVWRLARAKYVELVAGSATTGRYRLRKDQPEAPRLRRDGSESQEPGLGNANMWRTMKMLATFDVRQLAAHASTPDVTVTLAAAKSYVKHLKRAGYLAVVAPATPGHRPGTGRLAIYRLLPAMNTGPLVPQIQRTDWVWDPNQRRVVGPEAGGAK